MYLTSGVAPNMKFRLSQVGEEMDLSVFPTAQRDRHIGCRRIGYLDEQIVGPSNRKGLTQNAARACQWYPFPGVLTAWAAVAEDLHTPTKVGLGQINPKFTGLGQGHEPSRARASSRPHARYEVQR
jgi:hypothetical protein